MHWERVGRVQVDGNLWQQSCLGRTSSMLGKIPEFKARRESSHQINARKGLTPEARRECRGPRSSGLELLNKLFANHVGCGLDCDHWVDPCSAHRAPVTPFSHSAGGKKTHKKKKRKEKNGVKRGRILQAHGPTAPHLLAPKCCFHTGKSRCM